MQSTRIVLPPPERPTVSHALLGAGDRCRGVDPFEGCPVAGQSDEGRFMRPVGSRPRSSALSALVWRVSRVALPDRIGMRRGASGGKEVSGDIGGGGA